MADKVVHEWVESYDATPQGRCTITDIDDSEGRIVFDDEDDTSYYVAKPKKMKLNIGDEIWFDPNEGDEIDLHMRQEHPAEWVKSIGARIAASKDDRWVVVDQQPDGEHPSGIVRVRSERNQTEWWVVAPTTFTLEQGDQLRFPRKLAASIQLEYAGEEGQTMADPKQILAALTEALTGAQDNTKDVTVVREGKVITLPEGMSYKAAREWLTKKEEEENTKVGINEQVDAFPIDGAYAFMRALKDTFGWTELLPTPGFFGGDTPPTYITVDAGAHERVQIIWGRCAVPAISGHFDTGVAIKDGRVIFRIGGETKKKYIGEVAKVAELTRRYVREVSIYKGKAIRVTFPDISDKTFHPLQHAPRFIDTRNIKETDLIFPDSIQGLVETTLFTPIRATDWCRSSRIPLKRGILLEGPFGTGKTLTGNVTAMLCERYNWTFVYIEDVKQLAEAIKFVRGQYEPAVIYAEDVDRADSKNDDDYGERSEVMNQLLNTMDGVDIKGSEIMIIVTTNYPEHINRAMLRPGRLDAVIPVRAPDARAVERLVRLFARNLLSDAEDLSVVGQKLEGNIPAVIREVVERSKLAAISRVARLFDTVQMRELQITASDLEVAADGMIEHLKLLAEPPIDNRSDAEKAATIVGEALKEALTPSLLVPTGEPVAEPV